MNNQDRHKITALLEHLQLWTHGDRPLNASELAEAYVVDAFVVRRLGESVGVVFEREAGVPVMVDENEVTAPIYVGSVELAS